MNQIFNEKKIYSFDDRRDIVIPGDASKTVEMCAELFIAAANQAIEARGSFSVALSGGSTPIALYKLLSKEPYRNQIDWSKVLLFWSDERCVPPDHPESNFGTAMQAGLKSLPVPQNQIFRMQGDDEEPERAALNYEECIRAHTHASLFDLVMVGVGEDGHVASLFPKTHGLHPDQPRLAIANYVPQKECWRLSLTFDCINASRQIFVFALGKNKAEIVKNIFNSAYEPDLLPAQRVGIGIIMLYGLWIEPQAASYCRSATITSPRSWM